MEGNTLAGYEISSCEKYRANSNHEDNGIGCLLLSLNQVLGKDKIYKRLVDNYELSVKARVFPW